MKDDTLWYVFKLVAIVFLMAFFMGVDVVGEL